MRRNIAKIFTKPGMAIVFGGGLIALSIVGSAYAATGYDFPQTGEYISAALGMSAGAIFSLLN